MIESIRTGSTLKEAAATSCKWSLHSTPLQCSTWNPSHSVSFLLSVFQFAYTTVFGFYSCFLFLRTGPKSRKLWPLCFYIERLVLLQDTFSHRSWRMHFAITWDSQTSRKSTVTSLLLATTSRLPFWLVQHCGRFCCIRSLNQASLRMRCTRYDLILSHVTVHYAVIDQQLVLVQIRNILVIIVVLSKN